MNGQRSRAIRKASLAVATGGASNGKSISKETLAMCDASAENLKQGKVSEPIDLDKYVENEGGE